MIKYAAYIAIIYATSILGLMVLLFVESKKIKQRQEELKKEIKKNVDLTDHRIDL